MTSDGDKWLNWVRVICKTPFAKCHHPLRSPGRRGCILKDSQGIRTDKIFFHCLDFFNAKIVYQTLPYSQACVLHVWEIAWKIDISSLHGGSLSISTGLLVCAQDGQLLYGVFDGHGQKGHDVSNFAMDMLPKCIIKDERCFTTRDWGPILIEAFKKTQNFIMVSDKGKTIQAQMSGTTATVHASALRLARPCLGRIATVVLVSSGMTLPGI